MILRRSTGEGAALHPNQQHVRIVDAREAPGQDRDPTRATAKAKARKAKAKENRPEENQKARNLLRETPTGTMPCHEKALTG